MNGQEGLVGQAGWTGTVGPVRQAGEVDLPPRS
jgi:hypothetical protein